MIILLVALGQPPTETAIGTPLAAMQQLVVGSIQAIHPFGEPVAPICNEKGNSSAPPPSRSLRSPDTDSIKLPKYESQVKKTALPHSQYGAPTASPRSGPRGWLLILETGISRSKLLGPRWADIGREQPCIHIRQQLASYRSPGQEKLAIASNGSKNKFRRRTIPIIE